MMATAERLPFSWRSVESLPDLERLRLVLETLPDEEIVAELEAGRGRGRNDYPVRAMWRALIAGIVFQHASMQSLLRELGRNPALLEMCGFDPLPYQSRPRTRSRGEAGRGACGTIKYRCPPAAFDLDCKGRGACHRAGGVKPGEYGRIVRVDLDSHDRRIFTPTPWGSPSWRRGYNRRSAMERINARLDRSFNFETHYIRGRAKMKTRVWRWR